MSDFGFSSMKYQSPEQLRELLTRFVEIPSITQSSEEVRIAEYIYDELQKWTYFQMNPTQLTLYPVGQDGRHGVMALAKAPRPTSKTVILLAHFDVVDVEEFGAYEGYAFRVNDWTAQINDGQVDIPPHVQEDIAHGTWLFGRGVMDMKCGLSINVSLLERACNGDFDGNVLFLGVPDEERHSDGMIGSLPLLLDWQNRFQLRYEVCIDTEPSFAHNDARSAPHVYSGTVGKILFGLLCVGKETHIEAPFEGLSATTMIAEIVRTLELNPLLSEQVAGESLPPITCLWMRDLKHQYSVQTAYKAGAYFNMLYMEKKPSEIMGLIERLCSDAVRQVSAWMTERMNQLGAHGYNFASDIRVLHFEEVDRICQVKYATEHVRINRELAEQLQTADVREATMSYVNQITSLCVDLHPCVVLFVAPPVYPAVSSANDAVIHQVISDVTTYAAEHFNLQMKHKRVFPGICDLSFTGIQNQYEDLKHVLTNMPVWRRGYNLPIDVLKQLDIPILNLGPFGKDAHKWTERLEVDYSLRILPELLCEAIKSTFGTHRDI